MNTDALLTMTQWLSPSYPVGGFAWSHGLEMAIADGLVSDQSSLTDWLSAVLEHGAGRTDAILLGLAHRSSPDELSDIADLAEALSPSAERRGETMGQGAAFATTTRAVWGLDVPDMPYPVAIGRAAGLIGLPATPVAQVLLQAMTSNLVQAAQRLMPLGQTKGQIVLAQLSPLCGAIAAEAVELEADDIGSAAFAVDITSMRHETQSPRLFRS
ncbi:urease accessory protein UreF [Flavimaricola marinus]|nr:urease accessory protein UreF [Flavimaricola marinus]